ncbi:efflux RND transporter permease subunit [Teredinibacter waterburyi]|uniref:efflux RND transporter permease subunit n=1 Tax=Teredinibacter waterburyi TaxID=1500538 RepID=UPI00165F3508|nr:MMPL family transporter [Teredinibacter waterburyi]
MDANAGNLSLTERYAHFVTSRPWLTIAIALAVSLSMMSGMQRFAFDQDYRVFFSEENPHLSAFERQQKIYTKNDNVLFVIVPNNGEVFNKQTLAAVEEATEQAWQLPYVLRVDSVTNFQYSHADGDELIVEPLVSGAEQYSAETLKTKQSIALTEPNLRGQLISEDAEITALNIVFEMPQVQPEKELPELVGAVRELQSKLEASYPVTVKLTGVVMLSNAFFEASMKDQQTLVPAMYAVILLVIAILLRSATATLATLLVVFLSMLSALGSFFWLGGKLSPPSFSASTIITTLAVADSIHILVTLFEGMRRGMSKVDAMRRSLVINIAPVFLTSLTTAIGFLSMNLSDTPPFNDLGNITAWGVVVALFLSMTLLPALITILPVKASKKRNRVSHAMDAIANFIIAKRTPVLIAMVVFSIVAVSGIKLNSFDDNFVGYFDTSIQFRNDTDFANDNLTGIYQIQYSLESGEDYGVSDPVFLAKVDRFVEWFRSQPEITHVNSFTDTFKRINKNMYGDDNSYYRLPEDKALAAQYLLLYEMSLPEGLDLNNQMDIGKSSTQIIVTVTNTTSKHIAEIEQRGRDWLLHNTGMSSYGVGPAVMFAHISDTNMRSMFISSLVAILVISLIIMLVLRSVRLGVISLVPNLLPIAAAFGAWGYLVAEVNVGVSMVTGMALGIVVDDTVHFLSKYQRARIEQKLTAEAAIRYAFSSVGVALVVTTIVLMAGFMILAQSSFGMNSGMSQLTSVAIIFALIIDFLLLPILLLWLDKKDYAIAAITRANS